ncbi:unnamed protein product [Rhizophagus irregularis]|nr:unnamed protein product [Rhizophagus irregularis]CAB5305554.1 unnamed protein product [Rhizophagus irregularis]
MSLEYIISNWIECINNYYLINGDGDYDGKYKFLPSIDDHLNNDILEFVEANKTLVQEQENPSIIQYHLQAYYTSRKLTEILVDDISECMDCEITITPLKDLSIKTEMSKSKF